MRAHAPTTVTAAELSDVVTQFHQRVKTNCWDSLAGELLQLHAPVLHDATPPMCQGCDRRDTLTPWPRWPCRSYRVLAATVLNLPATADATAILADMLTQHAITSAHP